MTTGKSKQIPFIHKSKFPKSSLFKLIDLFGVLPMVSMTSQCRPKFRHWLPLVTIGTNGTPMATNGNQWGLPLAANHVCNLQRRQNYQRAK